MEVVYDEMARINALQHYEILNTPPDGNFDRLTSLASRIFKMPIAIISLVDTDRIWFKSHYGIDLGEIDRAPGLCASAIMADDVYLVEDARNDPRTMANPLVAGQFGLQFYAAAPLKTKDGHKLGTFCLIDRKQRYLTTDQQLMLEDLAAIVMAEIEVRLAARTTFVETNALIAALETENAALKRENQKR